MAHYEWRWQQLEIAFQNEHRCLIRLPHFAAMRSCQLMERKAPRRATADRKPSTLDCIKEDRLQHLRNKELTDNQCNLQVLNHENELKREQTGKREVLEDVRTQEEEAIDQRLQAEDRERHRHEQVAQAHNRQRACRTQQQGSARAAGTNNEREKTQSAKATEDTYARLEKQ
jgi:hypothetical protein